MRMRSVLTLAYHMNKNKEKFQNYRLSLVFITLIEELP